MPTGRWYWSSRPGEALEAVCWRLSSRYLSRFALRHVIFGFMNSLEALETLRRSEHALRGRGVRHAALFGSVARGNARPDSDIDIMIEIDPDARVTIYDYVDLKEFIAKLFDGPVDVVNREGLKSYVRPTVTD